MSAFPSVLSEGWIGSVRVPNRVVFPAVQMNYANPDGTVSEKLRDFYCRVAEGGCGLIVTGTAVVSADSLAFDRVMRVDKDEQVPGLAHLFSEIKKRGCVPGIQLIHYGRQASTAATGGPLPAPSAIPCPLMSKFDKDYRVVEMTLEDVRQVRDDFIRAGARAAQAGAEVIEIHAAHGYLLNEFLSPYSNKRTDEYGGDVHGRTRLVREILEGVRAAAGKSCAVSVRVSGHEHVPGGLTPGDFREIIPILEEAGMDFLNVSAGVYESLETIVPKPALGETPHLSIARELKSYSNKPVCAVGSIRTLEKAEAIVAGKDADFVAMARAHIADPSIVKKSREGDLDGIRKCTSCNRCAFWSTGDPHMVCSVNPFFSPAAALPEDMPCRLFEAITSIDILSPPKTYIQKLLRTVCERLEYHFGSVIKVENGGQATMVSAYNLPDDYIEQAWKAAPLLSSPIREAMETRRTVVLQDPLDDPRMAPWRWFLMPRGVRLMLWVPLLSGTTAFGAYVLYGKHPRQVPKNELDILEQMARLISIAIVSNHYLDALVKKTDELKRANEELRSAQKRLVQSEKMSAVGQLAAGVAHEINNPLGIILGFSQAAGQRVRPGDPLEFPLKSIQREAVRCKDLVQNLLTFSRTGSPEFHPISLDQAVEGALGLIQAKARMNSVEIQIGLSGDPSLIMGDRTQLQQIVVNLASNAIDAMPKGGTLQIRTEILEESPHPWICLKVADTGTGIPPEIQSKIFEPFFTTKSVGEGTGLGLSLVYEIVRKHSGTLELNSRPGLTEFRVKFPIQTA